jgi:hypothetical protein
LSTIKEGFFWLILRRHLDFEGNKEFKAPQENPYLGFIFLVFDVKLLFSKFLHEEFRAVHVGKGWLHEIRRFGKRFRDSFEFSRRSYVSLKMKPKPNRNDETLLQST